MGLVLGIVLALILGVLFFVYTLPALRDNTPPKTDNIDINVQVPADDTTPIPEVKP